MSYELYLKSVLDAEDQSVCGVTYVAFLLDEQRLQSRSECPEEVAFASYVLLL